MIYLDEDDLVQKTTVDYLQMLRNRGVWSQHLT